MDHKRKFRAVVFGIGRGFQVWMVSNPPVKAEDCGMYVHIEDFEKFKIAMDEFAGGSDEMKRDEVESV